MEDGQPQSLPDASHGTEECSHGTEECSVCLDRPRSVRFACGHLVSCGKCAVSLQRCPFCRQIVVDKHGFLIPFKPAESSNEEESEDEESEKADERSRLRRWLQACLWQCPAVCAFSIITTLSLLMIYGCSSCAQSIAGFPFLIVCFVLCLLLFKRRMRAHGALHSRFRSGIVIGAGLRYRTRLF